MSSNPKKPWQHQLDEIEAFRPLLKILGAMNPKLIAQFEDIEKQAKNLKRMIEEQQKFGQVYGPLGWTNYDRMNTEIVAKVLKLEVEEGESVLINYHLDPDNLQQLEWRFYKPSFSPWKALYERAVERAKAQDHLSAIPLLLIIIDGICQKHTQKHPFSGGADAPVFDTQTSGPGGLSEGFSVLGTTRKAHDETPLSMPFRHGIIHGINPNYGYPIVTAKVFNLLQATVDYFNSRQSEDERISKAEKDQHTPSWGEVLQSISNNSKIKTAVETWRPRPIVSGFIIASSEKSDSLLEGTPELLSSLYLNTLIKKNYGNLAKITSNHREKSYAYWAGRTRKELKEVDLLSWEINKIEDISSVIANIYVVLCANIRGKYWRGTHTMRLMHADAQGEVQPRNISGGSWLVGPSLIGELWRLSVMPNPDPAQEKTQ